LAKRQSASKEEKEKTRKKKKAIENRNRERTSKGLCSGGFSGRTMLSLPSLRPDTISISANGFA
jgi:hypothetical protein